MKTTQKWSNMLLAGMAAMMLAFGLVVAACDDDTGGGAAAEPVEEKPEFNVILKEFAADKKIGVIKEIRAITGLDLKEAKGLVEDAPKTVKENVTKAEADKIKEQLVAAGATVEIQ